MAKILITIITHNKYYDLFPKVWENALLLNIPQGDSAEFIAVTDDDEVITPKFNKYIKDNHIRLEIAPTDKIELEIFKNNPYVEDSIGWTQPQVYKTVQARNICRRIGMEEGFDYWLNIDGDILPPRDALMKLREENKDYIAGWTYCKKTGQVLLHPNKLIFGEVFSALYVPMYCTLHSRKCFIDCPFELWNDRLNKTDDERRMIEIRKKGYKMYVHPKVFCQHLMDNGEPYARK